MPLLPITVTYVHSLEIHMWTATKTMGILIQALPSFQGRLSGLPVGC